YRLLVILRPPPGYSFIPESTQQRRAGRIRVALECLCSGERLPGQKCFLHASGGQLPTDQGLYLLDTLCTGTCLDVEKVACWIQMLVVLAWLLLPYSSHCQLMALPSRESCSFQLCDTSGLCGIIEVALAVQQA
ncbi:IPIL1 protein, partial [Pomatorhinus ruficollis]|nr:IPIL1 protein [Pomatorhinus ruficollis]